MSRREVFEFLTANAQATDSATLTRHFDGGDDLLPLWIAEPYIEVAPAISEALRSRAGTGWYGYETRPDTAISEFWSWMAARHDWDGSQLATVVSPSVGTSIGVLLDLFTDPGSGVILQPPAFSDFKALVAAAGRRVVRNPVELTPQGYRMDLDGLAASASDPSTRAIILCNPHNPVGRVWTPNELAEFATVCARHEVFVIADEIHADLTLAPHVFTPFSTVAAESGVSWAALHGPIKTFGLAGVCDTLLIAEHPHVTERFEERSSQLHLTRNNVFGLAAFDAAYRTGAPWLDDMMSLVATNRDLLKDNLADGIELCDLEGTYMAWLDCRGLQMDVPTLAHWLASSARLGLSPGHWFGREGAGFARMTIATPTSWIELAIERLNRAVAERS